MNDNTKKRCIRGAIFDVDGTLLDSMKIWDNAGERYLQSRGRQAEPGLSRILFSMSLADGATYLKETYELPETTARSIRGSWISWMRFTTTRHRPRQVCGSCWKPFLQRELP